MGVLYKDIQKLSVPNWWYPYQGSEAYYTNRAWIVCLGYGYVDGYNKADGYYIWPVRAGQ